MISVTPPELGLNGSTENKKSSAPTLIQSHEGEYAEDHGDHAMNSSSKVNLYSMCAALNSCNLGYDIGVNTGAGPLIQKSLGLSNVQIEIFLGSLNFFAIFGAFFAHTVSDRCGRRYAFVVAAIFFVLGIMVMVVSNSLTSLMIGRLFVGLGVGFGFAIDPIYIAEIAPAAHRGRLVTWSEIATNVGIVFGFISGLIFGSFEPNTAWRYMFVLGAILPFLLVILVFTVMPESPRWLVQKQRYTEAKGILKTIYGEGYDVDAVVENIKDSLAKEVEAERGTGWDVILDPSPAFKRMLIVGLGSAISQQLVGIDAIQYFLIFIIAEAGIEDRLAQTWILIGLGVLKLFFTVVAGNIFDKKGRRTMMFLSLGGCGISLLVVAITYFLGNVHPVVTVVGLACYLSMFSLGLGPGAWLIPSEVFTLSIRAKAMSLATFLNRLFATIMSSTFLSFAGALTWGGFFCFLASMCLILFVFFYFMLPETKGRALEDMALYFAEITGDRSILDVEIAHQAAHTAAHMKPTNKDHEPTML